MKRQAAKEWARSRLALRPDKPISQQRFGDLVVPEDRLLFFEQHHPLLLKMRPIDLLDTEQGTAAVMRLIEGLESGAFA